MNKIMLRWLAVLGVVVNAGFAQQSVTSLTLINSDTDLPMAGYDPLVDGTTIDLATLPTRNMNIRANTSPATVGSVRFGYDGNANQQTETSPPYALMRDTSGDYWDWTPDVGNHTVTATPYTGASAGGTAGTPLTVNFTVTDSGGGGGGGGSGGTGAWIESGGLLIMEMENTESTLGKWVEINSGDANYVAGATGSGHLEFTGNTINGGTAASPLTYTFKINKGGTYYINLRARKRLDGAAGDKCNDCYIKVAGNFTSGSTHYDVGALKVDTKLYGGNANNWGWATNLDSAEADHVPAIYNFVAGETYTLTISGRSIRFNLDRIVFRHSSVALATARDAGQPESQREGGGAFGYAYDAITDFPAINAGEVPYYKDTARNALAINAATVANRDKYARATVPFDGAAGVYDATITALGETDGECHYRFLVNGAVVGTAQNRPTATDYVPQDHVFPNVNIPAGATIAVESDDVSNGLVPEGTGFGYARGRWTTLSLTPASGATGDPVANAGADKNLVLPDNLVVLDGSGTDNGSITAYSWSQVSGPGTASLSGQATATLTASDLVAGTYTFRLTVTDNESNTAFDDVAVVVLPEGGAFAAVVSFTLINADSDQPVPGFDPISEGAVINKAGVGTSSFNIRANTAPDTDFGSVKLALSGATTQTITESVPVWALFGDKSGDYNVGTLNNGAHTLTCTPYDQNAGAGSAGTPLTLHFTVVDQTDLPVADAGPDQVLNVPASQVVLSGSGSDNGSITAYAWSQVSGPNTAALSGSATATLTASGLVEGAYVFRLTVTDNEGNLDSDEASVAIIAPGSGAVEISGELKQWHKVTLTLDGPPSSEKASPNPFSDYRMNVTFTHPASGLSYVVPGYFAADGNAADSGATSGNKWRAHLSPDHPGTWNYVVSFRTGSDVALESASAAGTALAPYDNAAGSFVVAETDKTGRDFRGKGRLQYVGKHHLRFAGTGEYFLKAGADAPENFLAYDDFDATPNDPNAQPNLRKSWSPHAGDYDAADASAYTWAGGKGSEILGAVNYLSGKGLNAFSFLTYSLDGDDDNVFPHLLKGSVADYESVADNARWANAANGVHHDRFDVSKMAQWERVFGYGDKKGMYLHFKTMETENELKMDGGDLGRERKLYYRELIARYGHHLALNWNLGEEINNATSAQKRAWADYFWKTDPYHHHIVIHNGANHYELMGPATGSSGSECTGFSLQTNQADFSNVFPKTLDYITRSVAAGKPWVVACDEPGDASHALRPAGDEGNSWTDGRKNALWGNIMAGGAGCEFYFGYQHAESDLNCQDWRSRDGFWDYCRYALEFFRNYDVPFWDMKNNDALASNANSWCLGKAGDTYVVYLKNGGTTTLNLAASTKTFQVRWYDPRNGGGLQNGSVTEVVGGSTVSLGTAPSATTSDWVVLVQKPTPVNMQAAYVEWASSQGLAGADANPSLDLDGDGLTNMEEFMTGHSPQSAASVFTVESIQTPDEDADQIVVEWESKPDRVYSVSRMASLDSPTGAVIADGLVYPQGSHTVDVSRADSGYFKVNVRFQ